MTIKTVIAAVIGGSFLFSGCAYDTPEYRAEKAEQNKRASASNTKLVTAELAPLIDVCLDVLETGQPVSSDKMAALGFSKMNTLRGEGYKKKRGDSGWDRVNGSNTILSYPPKKNWCQFLIGNFSGYREAFVFVANSLNSRGYKPVGNPKKGFKYQKGDQVYVVTGAYIKQTYQTAVSISREN
ncbi:hypothetical protein [Ruegeria sp.]|uniref:hypothetical protein n=1 Tax=Ruegeria sp. TaxID=1879320 RepID=UPI003B591980